MIHKKPLSGATKRRKRTEQWTTAAKISKKLSDFVLDGKYVGSESKTGLCDGPSAIKEGIIRFEIFGDFVYFIG